MNIKKQYDYFGYLQKTLTGAFCSKNEFHSEMYELGHKKGFMVSFLNPLNTFRSISINDIVTENGTLDEELAEYSGGELRNMGLALPINFSHSHRIELNASYILNSSLCWVSVESKKGRVTFFATKNPQILSALFPYFADTEKKKKFTNFQTQFTTTFTELNSGTFNVVALTNDNGGLRLGKARVNCNSKSIKITTMYALGNFIDSISNYLCKNKVLIVYTENSEEKNLVTTLVPDVLSKWLGTKDKQSIARIVDNSQNPFVYGELILPNLYKRNEFISLHVLSIKSIKNFQ